MLLFKLLLLCPPRSCINILSLHVFAYKMILTLSNSLTPLRHCCNYPFPWPVSPSYKAWFPTHLTSSHSLPLHVLFFKRHPAPACLPRSTSLPGKPCSLSEILFHDALLQLSGSPQGTATADYLTPSQGSFCFYRPH